MRRADVARAHAGRKPGGSLKGRPYLVLVILLAATSFAAPKGDPRLIDAAKSGRAGVVASLLAQKADANSAGADGTTALHWAVRQDHLEIADRLIRAGADVKAANRYGITALYLASVNGSAAMIEKLLKAGADANATSTEGETALMTVARTGNVEAAKVLLAHGAGVNAVETWKGQTALMWAAAQNHPAMARELIAHGAEVNGRSRLQTWERQTTAEPREKWLPLGHLTPLLFAAREGALESAGVLVEAGADVNATDPEGISPVVIAIINGHYDVAAYLLEHGADPNLADKTGRAPLFAAVDAHDLPASNRPPPKELHNRVSSFDLVKLLLAKGAEVNAQLKTQQPYRAKLDRGTDTMLTTGTTPLLRAAKAADLAVMRLLLDKGADPKLATRTGITPLMAAANVGTKEEDTTGRFKTEEEMIEAIGLLLETGVDINATTAQGQTALHGAALWGKDKVVEYLVAKGAKLDVKDRRGFTPLDAALGKAGGVGFDGASGVVHESTAALLRKLGAQ
jgi:ankyrin repeat protein